MKRVVRQADPSEYMLIASQHINWVKKTPWFIEAPTIVKEGQSALKLAEWMHEELANEDVSSLWVTEHDGMIAGQCGVSIMQHILPPHMTYVFEWLWTCYDAKSGLMAWKSAEEWGRQRGALYSFKSIKQPSKGDCHREQVRWRYFT